MCETRIVAYIDILGITQAIAASKNSKNKQKKLLKMYSELQKLIKRYEAVDIYGKNRPDNFLFNDFSMSFYSDTIVISIEFDLIPFWIFLRFIKDIQYWFLYKFGYFTRGGIVIGDLYHKNEIVFGNAYLRAYDLESTMAIYPRVIVEQATLENALKLANDKRHANDVRAAIDKVVSKDTDGFYYVDYIKVLDGAENIKYVDRLKIIIEDNLNRHYSKKIKQKMDWVLTKISELEKQ